DQFRALDFARLNAAMAEPLFVDLRNVYPPEELTRHAFRHLGIGRASAPRLVAETAAPPAVAAQERAAPVAAGAAR
ncbi:hypothetical protein J8J32_22270, partial [Mycobacterium tuberculosis]|nr:hypothetical protein [Mycobacterium tuberculosis]